MRIFGLFLVFAMVMVGIGYNVEPFGDALSLIFLLGCTLGGLFLSGTSPVAMARGLMPSAADGDRAEAADRRSPAQRVEYSCPLAQRSRSPAQDRPLAAPRYQIHTWSKQWRIIGT